MKKMFDLPEESVVWEKVTGEITTEKELEEFIDENVEKQYKSFKEYFNVYIAEHDLELPEIMRKSNIDKGYFYNILNGDRKPQRDKIICLCIGARMDLEHLNRGLRLGKFSKLDPKNERDLWIKFAIDKGFDNVIDVNLLLDKKKQDILK